MRISPTIAQYIRDVLVPAMANARSRELGMLPPEAKPEERQRLCIDYDKVASARANWISRADFACALLDAGFIDENRIELTRAIRIMTPGEKWVPRGYGLPEIRVRNAEDLQR